MTIRRRRTLITLVVVVAIPALAYVVWQWIFPVQHEPPKVIGVETGPGGQFLRRIVYEGSYRVTGWLPDPHGGHQTRDRYSHFFLEVPGAARQELTFLPQVLPDAVIIADLCQPVQNTPLWISAGYFRAGPQIDVVVFDPTGVRVQRTIVVSPDGMHPGRDFWFENGNKTLRFRSTNGVGTYEVGTDTVAP